MSFPVRPRSPSVAKLWDALQRYFDGLDAEIAMLRKQAVTSIGSGGLSGGTGGGTGGGGYTPPAGVTWPRVATIFSKTDINDAAGKLAIGKFQRYVTDFGWWPDTNPTGGVPAGQSMNEYLPTIQPAGAKNTIYWHSCMYEIRDNGGTLYGQSEPGSTYWRSSETGWYVGGTRYRQCLEWFVCHAGSTLTSGINASATSIPVADLAKFTVGEYAIIGVISGQTAEMVKITAKSASSGAGTLTVERGKLAQDTAYSGGSIISVGGGYPAVSHSSGDAIRSVAYAFGNPQYMMLNITATCPTANGGFGSQTYNQWFASFATMKLGETHWNNLDGFFMDNHLGKAVSIFDGGRGTSTVDSANTNTASGISDSAWLAGMQDQSNRLRTALGTTRNIIGNTGGRAADFGAYYNGGMIEGLDLQGENALATDTDGSARQYYQNWSQNSYSGRCEFIVNGSSPTSTASDAQFDYKAMRNTLGFTFCLGNGFAVYDEFLAGNEGAGLDGGGHQTSWWYDEYDNAGAGLGYLGQPIEDGVEVATNIWRRRFQNGVVVWNHSGSSATVALGGPYKRINGSQAPTINDGATGVTSQLVAAHDARILVA